MPTSTSETLKQVLRQKARKQAQDPNKNLSKTDLVESLSDTVTNTDFF
jgi:hypothetical protein